MIIAWVPGVKPTSYNYVGTVFTQITGGTASGTGGGGAGPGTPTYDLAGQTVTTETGGLNVSRSVIRVG